MGMSYRNPLSFYFCTLLVISYTQSFFSQAENRITRGQLIRDGETILSSGQNFELGFFSPGNSTLRYVGIWYHNISVQSVIWVANRENPIPTTAGVLTIASNGNLMVLDGNENSVWSTNTSIVSINSTAVLLDTGNLILSRSDSVGDPKKALWQSFNDTADTYLPDMRVYLYAQAGENRAFTSWKSSNDPSTGRYSMGLDPRGSPQIVIWEGLDRRWRSGHWNGLVFTGVPNTVTLYFYGFRLTNEGDGNMYFTYTTLNSSHTVRFRIRWDGIGEQLIWDEGKKDWGLLQSHPSNTCEIYNNCGNFGKCSSTDSPICTCIEGFEPKYVDQWNKGNWSGGCVRRTQLQCEKNSSSDGFLVVEGVKLPDYADTVVAKNTNECEDKCLNNCSCNAYTFVIGIGCMVWIGDLVDIEHFSGGTTLYIRLAKSELGSKRKISNLAIITIVVSGTIFLSISIWLLWRFRAKLKARECCQGGKK
uniref:non-specific serine/threonine protein kinase n=1 Tax=Davidia involucrata TaxID=16924 RepID=A0A5B7CET4_DAVIN